VTSSVHMPFIIYFLQKVAIKSALLKVLLSSIRFCIKETQRNATNNIVY